MSRTAVVPHPEHTLAKLGTSGERISTRDCQNAMAGRESARRSPFWFVNLTHSSRFRLQVERATVKQSVTPVMETTDSLAGVVAARRNQWTFRVGLACAIAALFYPLAGLVPSLVWLAAYVAQQGFELYYFRDVGGSEQLGRQRTRLLIVLLVAGNVTWAAFGVLEALHSGTWGLMCALLLWSGAIMNGTMVSANSRAAFAASILPPTLFMLTSPIFILSNGGGYLEAIATVIAGVLNAGAAVVIWKTSHRLFATAARERESTRLALLDPETGLSNRYAMTKMADDLLAGLADGESVLVVAIRLDRYDYLYRAAGHDVVTSCLREVARRVTSLEPRGIGRLEQRRLGAVWIVDSVTEAGSQVQELFRALEAPLTVGDLSIDVSVTLGLSLTSDVEGSGLTIVDRAVVAVDQALRQRKASAMFDPDLYGSPAANLSLMSEMREALEADHMDLHYQPKLDLRTGAITGVEALARWNHPVRGLLMPDDFIPIAEETGRIAALTVWGLERSVADQRRLAALGSVLEFSVNLSGHLIDDTGFHAELGAILLGAEGSITLEVTENAVMDSAAGGLDSLIALSGAGRLFHRRFRGGHVVPVVSAPHPRRRNEDRQDLRDGPGYVRQGQGSCLLVRRHGPRSRHAGCRRGRGERGCSPAAGADGMRPGAGLLHRAAHAVRQAGGLPPAMAIEIAWPQARPGSLSSQPSRGGLSRTGPTC